MKIFLSIVELVTKQGFPLKIVPNLGRSKLGKITANQNSGKASSKNII